MSHIAVSVAIPDELKKWSRGFGVGKGNNFIITNIMTTVDRNVWFKSGELPYRS